MKERKKVAIVCEGVRQVHAAADPSGNYATFCGLDGEEQTIVEVEPREKINCPQCLALWNNAKRYRKSDFEF